MRKKLAVFCLAALGSMFCACAGGQQASTEQTTQALPTPIQPNVSYADGSIVVESGKHGPEHVQIQLPDGTVMRSFFYSYDEESGALLTVEEQDQNQQLLSRGVIESGVRTESFFDSQGNLLRLDSYHSDNSLSSRSLFAYDSANNLIQHHSYDASGILNASNLRSYNEDNQLVYEESIQNDEQGALLQREVIFYGAEGEPINWESYDANGLVSFSVFNYNDDKLPLSTENYDGEGNLLSREEHSYDEQGRLIRSESYNGDNVLQSYGVFTFRENGMPEKDETFVRKADGSIYPLDYRLYDEQGRDILYVAYDAQGEEQYRMETEYTDAGDTKVTMRYPDGESQEFLNPVG